MPKKIDEETPKEEVKKKVVVVEEVVEEETPKEEEKEEVKKDDETVEVEKEESKNDSLKISSEEEKPNYLWIIIPTALLVGALVGGLITYFSGISRLSTGEKTPVPTVTSTPEATATPTSGSKTDVKRSDIKVQVLNGSGTSGLAGKAKTYLEGLGYKDVAVGNASSSDFAETEIQIKDSVKGFLDTITTDLSKNYTVSKETKVLTASSKFDIVITLGKK
ncbi:MAG TPA: LytR C-terminal domain-containing protein [Patescibacteria group bacterium]|nr:LytR C-terminal domain-containing protein [Patescibacteria group bacterium]